MDFSGVWVCWAVETFTSLALDGKDWDRGTLMGAFDNTLAAYGLLHTLLRKAQFVSHKCTSATAVHRLYSLCRSTTVTLSVATLFLMDQFVA
jgi:hypothetical protein